MIFIVTGRKKYKDECRFSAKSIKIHNPNLPIKVFTDEGIKSGQSIDDVTVIKEKLHPLKLKTKYLLESPFEKTLFLDSDTKVEGDLSALFKQLDRADFVIGKGPLLDWPNGKARFVDFVHEAHYNTGVFLYNKAPSTLTFLKHWFDKTNGQDSSTMKPGHLCDQHYFNQLLGENFQDSAGMKLGEFDNKIYNVRYLAYKNLTILERKQVLIKHWHQLNDSAQMQLLRFMKQKVSKILR